MRIPFTKAHGAKNDFLLTWVNEAPVERLPEAAIAICDRHTGVGADGWLLVAPATRHADFDAAIRLFNSDGSEAEISGNGTRCAAAFLLDAGLNCQEVRLSTGAGLKHLRLITPIAARMTNPEPNRPKDFLAMATTRATTSPTSGGSRSSNLLRISMLRQALTWRFMVAGLAQTGR